MGKRTMNAIKIFPVFIFCLLIANGCAAGNLKQGEIDGIVNDAIYPVMQEHNIPGMAVAVSIDGKRYFYNYGVASRESKQPVTNDTIFEIGSLSKTFTATLASYAQAKGNLALSDSPVKYLPSLQGSSFGRVSLLNLGTHTSGGLPLQLPDDVKSMAQLMAYFRNWKPDHEAGTYRRYSNPGIGLLGMVAAKSMNATYNEALEQDLFPKLGMYNSFIDVPEERMLDYAQGYDKQDLPARLSSGVLAAEAYGVKSNTTDLIQFVEANMRMLKLDRDLQRAIDDTHTGYFKAGEVTQALVWEWYPQPIGLDRLLAGNSSAMAFQDTIVTALNPPLSSQSNVLVNKTGSTNGFSAYVAFIPSKKIGIVILANKSYPIDARVSAAYRIFTRLDRQIAAEN